MCRRYVALLMALLLVSSSVWASTWVKKRTAPVQEVPAVEQGLLQEQETSTSEESQPQPEEELSQISQSLNGLFDLLKSSKYLMGADKIDQVLTGVNRVAEDVTLQNELIDAQNQQIEALKKELKKTRFFADFGLSAGVKEDTVKLGILGEMGLKLPNQMIVKTGITWSAFDAKDLLKVPSLSIEDITISAAVGYEW